MKRLLSDPFCARPHARPHARPPVMKKVIVSVGFVRRQTEAEKPRGWRWTDGLVWPMLRDWTVRKYADKLRWRHCEIAFNRDFFAPNTLKPDTMWAFGVMRYNEESEEGGKVFGKPRTFSNPRYCWIHLEVPFEEAGMIFRMCQAQIGKTYDYGGGERSVIWPRPSRDNEKRFYCANLTVSALQQAGIMTGLNPNGLTVDDIYRFLEQHPKRVVGTTPFEQTVNNMLSNTMGASSSS